MIRTQIYLPDELHNELKFLANKEGVNYSSLVREGVREILKKKKRKSKNLNSWKVFVGAGGRKGPKDLSAKIDFYLYGKK